MPKTVLVRVGRGRGRDLPTLAAFARALPDDLVARDEVWVAELYADAPDPGGARFRAVCDDARRIVIRPAAGEGFRDRLDPETDPVRPDIGYGALVAAAEGDALAAAHPRTRLDLEGLQIVAPDGRAVALAPRVRGCRLSRLLVAAGGAGPALANRGVGSVTETLAILCWGRGPALALSAGAQAVACLALRPEAFGPADGPAFDAPRAALIGCAAVGFRAGPSTPSPRRALRGGADALFADLRPRLGGPLDRAAPPALSARLGPDLFGRARPACAALGPIEPRPAAAARPAPVLSRARPKAAAVRPERVVVLAARRAPIRRPHRRPPVPKRFCHAALDAAFAHVADRADRLALCAGPPADYAAAATGPDAGGVALGGVAMTLGLGQGDYAVADGAVSGRRLLVSRQEGVPIDVSGQADHVALISTAEKSLLLVTPLETPVALVAGGAVAVDAFDDEIADPV